MDASRFMAKKPVRILLVEDDSSDAYLVQNALNMYYPDQFSFNHVPTLEEAMPNITLHSYDIVMLDLSLPETSGLEALAAMRSAVPCLPIIILTGFGDEAMALTALQQGAQDYLVKEHADGHLIRRAIRYAIERKNFADNLTFLANYDSLTGLANRSLFESRLELALARSKRTDEQIAVFFIDLDKFKMVNDSLGHDAGDEMLKEVAVRLKACLREYDTVARFGGDEFAAIIEGITQAKSCAHVAQKMLDTLSAPYELENNSAHVNVSIGISVSTHENDGKNLLQFADAAMYRAKNEGCSNYQFYTQVMHQETQERLLLEQELCHALKHKDRLCLYYQPKLDMATGMLVGAEALVRWNHPTRGMLAPREFLSLVEGTKLAGDFDIWVLETVCHDIQCWLATGLKPVQISIHLSSSGWCDTKMVDTLLEILKKAGIRSEYFAIEIEESTITQYAQNDYDSLLRIRETGMELHLDNFGAGVASLKLLSNCPLDAIKIDRHLISKVSGKNHHAIIKSMIELGHNLGMKIVAEGVETDEQRTLLASLDCDQLQGIIISKPLPTNDFFSWMGSCQRLAS